MSLKLGDGWPGTKADLEIEHCDGRSRTLGERSMNVLKNSNWLTKFKPWLLNISVYKQKSKECNLKTQDRLTWMIF